LAEQTSLVERGGRARSLHLANVKGKTLRPIIVQHVNRKSALMTDDAGQYRPIGKEFASHETVNHGIEEYVRGDAHSNTVEGFFSILKRGVIGTYCHVSEAHLSRHLAEFDFRYNTAQRLASRIPSKPTRRSKAQPASAPTGGLVKARTLKQKAMGLARLRRKRGA
jgi:transposase-like protein